MNRRPTCDGRTVLCLAMLLGMLCLPALSIAEGGGVTPTTTWVDIYSTCSTLDGQPIPPGAVMAAFDPQGVQCGEFTVTTSGWYGLMPCYGDDPHTTPDEGAVAGDTLSFTINGRVAATEAVSKNGTPIPPDTVVTWPQHGVLWEVNLHVTATLVLSITQSGALVTLSWQHERPDITAYEVWRSAEPYFTPGQGGALLRNTLTPGGEMTWGDLDTASDPVTHYYYRVRGLNAVSQPVTISRPVGRFTFDITHS